VKALLILTLHTAVVTPETRSENVFKQHIIKVSVRVLLFSFLQQILSQWLVSLNFSREIPRSHAVLCSLQDKESMIQVLRTVDKANGYCFGDLEERNLQAMMSAAVGADFQFNSYPFLITAVTHCDSSGLRSNLKAL